MKKLLLLIAIVSFGASRSAHPFEGILIMIPDFKTKPNPDKEMRFMIKGDNVLMELPGKKGAPGARLLSNRVTREQYMLMEMDGKKIAMKMNADMMRGMAGSTPSGQKNSDMGVKPEVTITNETRTIDGFVCKRVLSKMNDHHSEAWVTDELGITTGDLFSAPQMSASKQQYAHMPGLALEVWQTDGSGKVLNSMKIKPEPKVLEASLFEIPADYERVDMMQMMQGGQGNPEMMQKMMEMMGGKQ